MFKTIFMVLLLAHILGDFYFRSETQTLRKFNSIKTIILHNLLYTVVAFMISIPFFSIPVIISISLLTLSHFIIDLLRYICLKTKTDNIDNPQKERLVYIVYQFSHLLLIAIVAFLFIDGNNLASVLPIIEYVFDTICIPFLPAFNWILTILLIWKPTNITVKKLINIHKPESDKNERRSGAFIGFLERFLIAIFLYINQYAAIGLVLTAKSIARYDKISKDQTFAEYYLLGTLLSTLSVIIICFAIFN